jgi:CRP/FNR family cyclic AMP-dependent transcriptional regulator
VTIELSASGPGGIGLLVVDGLLTHRITIPGRRLAELLGRGGFLHCWTSDGGRNVPLTACCSALEPTRLAILDATFAEPVSPWPELVAALMDRAAERSRGLTYAFMISHLRGVEMRLLTLLWHLADRWGWVREEEVVLPLQISHRLLGELVGAHRPSVTAALQRLYRRGLVNRTPKGHWRLLGEPPSLSCLSPPPPSRFRSEGGG